VFSASLHYHSEVLHASLYLSTWMSSSMVPLLGNNNCSHEGCIKVCCYVRLGLVRLRDLTLLWLGHRSWESRCGQSDLWNFQSDDRNKNYGPVPRYFLVGSTGLTLVMSHVKGKGLSPEPWNMIIQNDLLSPNGFVSESDVDCAIEY